MRPTPIPISPFAARIISPASCGTCGRSARSRSAEEWIGREFSAWLTGLKETIKELPAFVQVAAEIGVKEVSLRRLVYF